MKQRDIFIQALQKPDHDARLAFLDSACENNPDLRNEIEALLADHQEDKSFFLDSPPPGIETVALDPEVHELPGTLIGPYKLLEVIGEGGMGTVYMADQTEPVHRRVAVKVIKTGMDTREVIARFEAERQALAMMDHPNIAKVLDAGSTDSGRPYFVMEVVKGKPITRFCDDQRLDTQSRLRLFQQVCHAVQHAHQKGIIHRDIKPSNVLVAMYDDQPVPKVIDFGVAKATGEELTKETMFTRFGQIVGTLEYMAPEQAHFNNLDIDTRCDIYSLGAILCELLSGAPPFDRERFRKQALDETLRMIREDEPTKPSTKLCGTAKPAHVASNRKTSVEKLGSILRGDLDWIVMKALDKDRTRRYATADEFAAEIGRFSRNEPVNAGPPSATYRFRKFARRNKTALAFIVTVAASLFLGIIGTGWQALRATHEASRATNEANKATRQTRIAQAVERFWNEDVLLQADPFRQTMRVDRNISLRAVFDMAAEKIEQQFGDEPLVAAEIYRVLSTAYFNLSQNEKAIEFVNREIPLRENQLGINDPTAIDARSRLGLFLDASGQNDRAITVQERELARCRKILPIDATVTLDTMNRLARAYANGRKYNEAARLLDEALALESAIHGEQNPKVAWLLVILGKVRAKLGDHEEAERLLKKALGIVEQSTEASGPFVAVHANSNLGSYLLDRHRYSDAEPYLRTAWNLSKDSLGLDHGLRKSIGRELANCLLKLRQIDDQRLVLEQLITQEPDDLDLKINLAGNLCNSGILTSAGNEPKKSIEYGRRAIALLENVLQQEPENSKALSFRTNTQYMLAMALAETGDHDQSATMFKQAIDSFESRASERPDPLERAGFLGLMHKYCGESFEKLERLETAAEHYERANELWSGVLSEQGLDALGAADGRPDHPDGWMLGELLDWLTSSYLQLARPVDALRIQEQKASIFPEWAERPQRAHLIAILRAYVKAAAEEYKEAIKIADKYCLEPSGEVQVVWNTAASIYALSAKAVREDQEITESDRITLADRYGDRAVDCLRRALATDQYPTAGAKKELLEDEDYSVLHDRADFQQLFPKNDTDE